MVNLALLLLLASAGEGFAFWPFCKSLCSAKFSCTSSQGTHELEKLFARSVKSDMSTAFLSGHCLCLQISPRELLAMEKTYCQDTGLSLVSWSLQVPVQIYFALCLECCSSRRFPPASPLQSGGSCCQEVIPHAQAISYQSVTFSTHWANSSPSTRAVSLCPFALVSPREPLLALTETQ